MNVERYPHQTAKFGKSLTQKSADWRKGDFLVPKEGSFDHGVSKMREMPPQKNWPSLKDISGATTQESSLPATVTS